MKKITVIGLGYSDINGMSVEGYRTLFENKGGKIICQTNSHAVVNELVARGMEFETLDSFYENAESFDEMYDSICKYVISCAKDNDILLCVSGSPAFGNILTQKLTQQVKEDIFIVPCPGVAEHMSETATIVMDQGYCAVPAHALQKSMIDTRLPLCITEVDNKFLASELKLMLLDFYPDDSKIYYFYGHPDSKYEEICLFDMDRQKTYDFSVNFVILPLDNFAKKLYDITALCEIMRILRGQPPESDIGSLKYDDRGCSWDREQTHESIRVNMIEEAYEVVQAINNDDTDNLIEELGDMLLQVVFHSQIAQETGEFTFSDVVNGVVSKLIRRHPHVFGDVVADNSEQALASWEDMKKKEKAAKPLSDIFASIPKDLPPLTKACKVQSKSEKAGFTAEYSRFSRGIMHGIIDTEPEKDAFGELLFAIADAARHLGYDPDIELMNYTDKVMHDFLKKSN